jgi:YbbR domain-containing protein
MKKEIFIRIGVFIISLILASILAINVSTLGEERNHEFSFTNSTEGVYVIEELNIEYRYDKTKYEVVPFVTNPYAVIKGDKSKINLLKWGEEPQFYIELSGKPPGTYREEVSYSGINKDLEVEFYPGLVELRLMEQQTIRLTPTIELKGIENVKENYIISVPELLKEEVLIRDIQDKLNQVGQVKGQIDVSKLTKTKEFEVSLSVYNREGNLMSDINLLDKTIKVKVPVEKKVTIVKEEVIKKIVVVEAPKEPKVDNPPPKQEGILSFINIPENLELTNSSSDLKWTGNVTIDVKGFKEGKYEMTVDDDGNKKTVKFSLKHKETRTAEENKKET